MATEIQEVNIMPFIGLVRIYWTDAHFGVALAIIFEMRRRFIICL
jgi:hypothetical protein